MIQTNTKQRFYYNKIQFLKLSVVEVYLSFVNKKVFANDSNQHQKRFYYNKIQFFKIALLLLSVV